MGEDEKMAQLADEVATLVVQRAVELGLTIGHAIQTLAATSVAMTAATAKEGRVGEALVALIAGISGDAVKATQFTIGEEASDEPETGAAI